MATPPSEENMGLGDDRRGEGARPSGSRGWLAEAAETFRTSPLFGAAVLITLALAGLNGLMVALMALGLNELLPGAFGQMTHFQEPAHRTHDLTFGFIFVPAIVGMLAQLRRPVNNVAGQLMAIVPSAALLLTLVLTLAFTGNAGVLQPPWITVGLASVVAFFLHPTWPSFVGSFSTARINQMMLALVAIAAVPLLLFAAANIGLQGSAADDHAAAGHYGFMAAFAFTVIGVGLVASVRPGGWRLSAWITGLLPALLGVTSFIYPDAASSLDPFWAVMAIGWGIVFGAAAEVGYRTTEAITLITDSSLKPVTGGRPGPPVWVKTLGVAALVVALLVVVVMFVGGGQHGPGLHAPSDEAGLLSSSPSEAVASGVGGRVAAAEATRTVEVTTLDSLAFEPVTISVAAGEAVTFVVTNTGQTVHEFTLGDAAMQQEHANTMAHMPAGVAHELPNSITLQPGETKQLTWRFGEPGLLEFACHEPGHYDGGMRGQIDVG